MLLSTFLRNVQGKVIHNKAIFKLTVATCCLITVAEHITGKEIDYHLLFSVMNEQNFRK